MPFRYIFQLANGNYLLLIDYRTTKLNLLNVSIILIHELYRIFDENSKKNTLNVRKFWKFVMKFRSQLEPFVPWKLVCMFSNWAFWITIFLLFQHFQLSKCRSRSQIWLEVLKLFLYFFGVFDSFGHNLRFFLHKHWSYPFKYACWATIFFLLGRFQHSKPPSLAENCRKVIEKAKE